MNPVDMPFVSFSQIIGQQRAKGLLKKAVSRGRISHAYLFTGIEGIGKTTTARALAAFLNCRAGFKEDACGECTSCRQMESGNAPDFLERRPEGKNIKIEQIKDLNRQLAFAPVVGPYRVGVLHQAESMTREAGNAFLKTLEEPPPGNVFVLEATEPLDLLPTILSRCQNIRFQPLSAEQIAQWLMDNKGVTEKEAQVVGRISGGSLGQAIRMLENDYLEKRQQWLTILRNLPGLSTEAAVNKAYEEWRRKEKEPGQGISEGEGTALTGMLENWEAWFRDLLVLRTGGGPSHLLLNWDFSRELERDSAAFTTGQLIDSLIAMDRAEQELRRKGNQGLVMEFLILTLKRILGRK